MLTCFPKCDVTVNLVLVRTVKKIIIFRCVRTNKNYFSEKWDCTN